MTDTDRPEVDDPRVLALAQARQQMAHENQFNAGFCPPWDGLTEQEQRLSLLDARNYLRAALKAGLLAAPVVVPSAPAGRAALREQIAAAIAEQFTPEGKTTQGMRVSFQGPDGWPATRQPNPSEVADAVLAVLFGPIPAGTDVATWTAIRAIQLMNEAGRQRDAALPAPADRAAVLSDAERQFLTFAPDQAADEMSFGDGFTDEDRAALEKLRRVADEAPPVETCTNCRGSGLDPRYSAGEYDCPECPPAAQPADDPSRMADEAQQPETRAIQCADAFWLRQPHAPHDWQQRPDAQPVRCPGVGEAQQLETQPRRGDAFEAWLKAQRDEYHSTASPQWIALDEVLDAYRLHGDTGTPLGEHVCEGRVAGDCECLDQPAVGAQQPKEA